ncbi:hypothetical protein IU487_31390 [Nocardia puris]|uniref:lipase family protein n=1 Tax=Nocardia puris TaxID=208602 RepID=UPI0018947519|nr:lipase family protein [Nocardia puris]MBF6215501.1 hypothetical protein [Nocardia puris]
MSVDLFYQGLIVDTVTPPGSVLRRRRVGVPQLDGAAGQAWQIVYASRSAFNAPIAASAIVIAPEHTESPSAALVYLPPFHGLGGTGNAPSQRLAAGTSASTEEIGAALARGWVVVVPDGHGMGLRGLGPARFPARLSGARAALDAVRTLERLPDVAWPALPALAWGYADGGRTAVAVAEHQPRYAPEIDLRGIAAGAVVADLAALARYHSQGPGSGLAVAAMIGLSRAYSHIPLRHVLSAPGYSAFEDAAVLSAEEIRAKFAAPLSYWCISGDPWTDKMWGFVLASERMAREELPRVPVHLYHGVDDQVVPADQARGLVRAYRMRGVEPIWREYPSGHGRAAVLGRAEALAHLDRFLHQAPTST